MRVTTLFSAHTFVRAILSLAVLCFGLSATAQKPIDFTELDKVALAELKQRNTPGAAIAVVKDGQVIYAKG